MKCLRLPVIAIIATAIILSGCMSAPQSTDEAGGPSYLPVSKQGTVVETISSAEVMVEANGVYYGAGRTDGSKQKDVDANGNDRALVDARRTALYTVLFGGTDPMISTPEEERAFRREASYFYDEATMESYITYEDTQFLKRVRIDGGTGLRVTKNFRINTEKLYQDLAARNIVVAREELAAGAGNPVIMVLPESGKGESPLDVLDRDQEARHAATVIQSYLTARGYDVVVPEQQAEMVQMTAAQGALDSGAMDYIYQMALSVGSDVYITFSGKLEDASYGTQKYALSLSAFETTTARLLGSETGYSQGRQGEVLVSIEEAMNDAVDKVLNRISNYWTEDLQNGLQYKVVVNIEPVFDDYQIDDIHLSFMDAVDRIALDSKELVLTKETIDYLIWVDPAEYDRGLRVYSALKDEFDGAGTDGIMGRVSINRKMLLLKIEYY